MHKTIKNFRNSSIIHSFINLSLVFCHILIYITLFWIENNARSLYYYFIYIISSFSLIPIILALVIIFKKVTKNILLTSELLIKYFMLLGILFSIITSISLSENQKELSVFLNTCPFDYEINDIDKIFGNYSEKDADKIKDNCENRRCFINEGSNDLNRNYLCNFNIKSKKNYCSPFSKYNDTNSEKLTNYINFCEQFVNFYKCQKSNSEFKYKIINYNYICPKQIDNVINIILLYFFLFVDIIILCTPWMIEISYLEDIISYFFPSVNNNDNNLKETNNTSKENNSENGNSENSNSNNFRREPTQTIIIDKIEKNINNDINNINNDNNKQNILIINHNKNNSEEIKINNNKTNTIDNNQSKSEIQLINNINNNIFKIFNKNNKA